MTGGKELLVLARLLLGAGFQTTSMGEAAGFSLVCEMNTLFEEYIGRLCGERSLAPACLSFCKADASTAWKRLRMVAASRLSPTYW